MRPVSGEDLKQFRKNFRWSQERMAAELGVSRYTVSRWELGSYPIPRLVDLAVRGLLGRAWRPME
jgi:transcriptional regulator with XRE-family HTH domain